MNLIYEPKGKAREYSPLALNIYKGCDHGCVYCYVPKMMITFNKDYKHEEVSQRKNFLNKLEASALKIRNSKHQVLLSFTTDAYTKFNDEINLTRMSLEILLRNKIPVAILTKGGIRCLKDLDLFKKFKGNIKVGTTLTFDNNKDSLKNEPEAALPDERIEMLRVLHENNIKTWVSLEPVFDPQQSLDLIAQTHPFVDHYKVGKLNHHKEIEDKIDWGMFLHKAVRILRFYNKLFYVKKDLLNFNRGTHLRKEETDMNYLCLKNTFGKEGN